MRPKSSGIRNFSRTVLDSLFIHVILTPKCITILHPNILQLYFTEQMDHFMAEVRTSQGQVFPDSSNGFM